MTGEFTLRGHRRQECVTGASKDGEKRISLHVDLMTVICTKSCAQQGATLGQQRGVAITELLEQVSGSLDISKKQRDCSCR
jgi:hypothetical protein